MTYIGDSSGVRNYVAFSDKDIRIDEHIRYQAEKNSLTSARSHAGLSPDFPDYRGLARDEQSLAGAALQYVKHLQTNIPSDNTSVKEPVSKILELLEGFDGKKSNLTDYQWVLTRTLFFKRWFGNWNYDPEQKIEVTVLEKDALENAGVDIKDTYGSLLAAINHYYNRQTPVTIKDDGSLAFFSNQNNKASLKDHRSPRDIFSVLDKIIENAVFYDFRGVDGQKKHENLTGQYLYKSAFRIGNSTFAATIILDEKKTTFSKVFKGYTISKIEVDGVDAASGSETTLREPVNRSTPSYITISEIEIYKADKSVSGPKIITRVERETVGSDNKLLQILAKIKSDAENSSKIVDENGEPRVVYHGSHWNPLAEEIGKAIFDSKRVGKNFDGDERGVAIRTRLFKDFFGDWEKNGESRAPAIKKEYLPGYPPPTTTSAARVSTGVDTIASGSKVVKDVSKVTDENGEPLLVHHGTTSVLSSTGSPLHL